MPFLLAIVMLAFTAANVVTAAPASAATRDIRVHLTNNSDSVLTLASRTLDGGCWNTPPPTTIAIDQTLDIASESCGFLTGTEFHVSYKLERTGTQMSLHYSNPFGGSDTFEENAPQGYAFGASGVIEDRKDQFGCNSKTCDGIPDDWKTKGVTIDPGGGTPPQFVDLPKMGVTLDRPNALVQLDWMKDDNHNQQLDQAAIDTVIRAFDQDPVTHRGATRSGITLIVDNGPNRTITPGGATWGSLSRAQPVAWTQDFLTGNRNTGFQEANFYTLLKNNFVPTGRLPIFHYAVAAANIAQNDSTSGLTTGDKLGFMVTLGTATGGTGSQDEQTGTFMHEFGHTLGLDHSGGEGNNVNFKPNYPSVMNYAWQTKGVFRKGVQVFDYSRDTMPQVDETKLTEQGGVNLGANQYGNGTTHSCTTIGANGTVSFTRLLQANLSPVDWNCDGITPDGGTGFDSNADGTQGILKGSSSDWSRLDFKTGGVGAGEGAKDTVTIPSSGTSPPNPELTVEQAHQIRVLPLDIALSYTGASRGVYHDSVTMSATLLDPGNGNAPIPGRTITFRIGSSASDVCSAVTDTTGTASCNIRLTQNAGMYTITASFDGDSMFKAGSDTSHSFTIDKAVTTTALTSSANPSVFGQPVTFTAAVTSPAGTPTGSVTFASDGTPLGTVGLTNGQATLTTAALPVGNHTITVSYGGDANFLGSSNTLSQTVNKAPTTTTLTSAPNPSTFGSPVTFTATVTATPPGSGIPSGTVTFSRGAIVLGTGSLDATGRASLTTSGLQVGTSSITAGYGGDGNFLASTSAPFAQAVACSRTISGLVVGTLDVTNSTCLVNATVIGSVTVAPGAALSVSKSSIAVNLTSTGARAVSVCDSSVVGVNTIRGTTGFVLLGDNGDDGQPACAGNQFTGVASLDQNTGQAEIGGNRFQVSLTVTNTSGTGPDAENTATEIEHNTIIGVLSCSGNVPPPTNDGQPNSVLGLRLGQCSAPGF